ncbi:hypothetical protein GW930_02715 [Candidatus Saccharibacteria bacterium]|nr:hypothetical protein [Candidatus Saccharibacteria bacterium]
MKKNDIATIVLIAAASVIVAFFATNTIFENIATEEVRVRTIEPMTTEIAEPDPAIFNEDAINPTVEVQIDADGE